MPPRSNQQEAAEPSLLADTAAERHVLGCCIIDPPRAIPACMRGLGGSDFANTEHGDIFDHLATMYASGFPLSDPRAIVKELKSKSYGCLDELVRDAMQIPNVATVAWHAGRVKNLARLRELSATLHAAWKDSCNEHSDAADVMATLEGRLATLRIGGAHEARWFQEVARDVIGEFKERLKNPEPAVLLSGFPSADQIGFVFGPGEICVLAARPGVGKTALSTQIAMRHAARGRTVLMASLEMRDKDLVQRVIVSSAGHNHQLIRTERIDVQIVADIEQAADEIGDIRLAVWSPGRVKASVIHAMAASLHQSSNLQLLVVDYLGYVRPDDPSRKRHEQIGDSMKALRDIGQKLQIPVLCLCQLNRDADQSEPKLSNLRESGDIEQDADVVAFLHHPDPKDSTRVDLIVAKDRQGATGRVTLRWDGASTMFSELTARDHSNFDPSIDEWNNR